MRRSRTAATQQSGRTILPGLSPNVFGIYARAVEIQALIEEGANVQADWPLHPAAHSWHSRGVDQFWR
jgi:ABC-type sulfate transport system substrate-binding protein